MNLSVTKAKIKGGGYKKQGLAMIVLLILLTSCQQEGRECVTIKNNSYYKGYGFFWFENDFQHSFTELRFIPVCTEKEDLIHFRNLNPQTGIDVRCFYDDSFLRTLAFHSKVIAEEDGYTHYLTPVYIEFEEAPDYPEKLKIYNGNEYFRTYPEWSLKDSLKIQYFLSYVKLYEIIKINKIEFLSFVEEEITKENK